MSRTPRPGRARCRAATAAAVVLLAGCSGADEDERTGDANASTVRSGLATLFAGDHAGERDVEAGNCFADELLGRVDAAQLREAGVVDGSGAVVAELPVLPEEVAVAWARAQLACTDFATESARAQTAASRGAADERAYAECLRGRLDDDTLEAALVETLTGEWDGPSLARLTDAQATCAAEVSR